MAFDSQAPQSECFKINALLCGHFPQLSFRAPVPFTALIGSGSDPEITVSPMSGTLAPCSSKGTLFVVTYRPTMYGKNHCAKFVVQASENIIINNNNKYFFIIAV